MTAFQQELSSRLDQIKARQLYRSLRRVDSPQGTHIMIGGQSLLNFASNDYLGLANEPLIKTAAVEAIERYGVGAGASRLLCGSVGPHHELEETLAKFKGTEAALTFSSGFATALGTICALLDKKDIVVIDKLSHACLVDAARLSGATLRVFSHNDLTDLESILKWAVDRHRPLTDTAEKPSVLIVTESVFSMDGDFAPLRELVTLKEKYGAWLMVDEAHATGLYGWKGRGMADHLGVADRVEIQMGTLGKALGSAGGYICGSAVLIEYLVNRARTFIFSTAPVPAASAAAVAAIDFAQSAAGEARRNQLDRLYRISFGRRTPSTFAADSSEAYKAQPLMRAIIPVIIGSDAGAVTASHALREKGFYVPAIRYPTVPHGTARLRISLSAAHTQEHLQQLMSALEGIGLNILAA